MPPRRRAHCLSVRRGRFSGEEGGGAVLAGRVQGSLCLFGVRGPGVVIRGVSSIIRERERNGLNRTPTQTCTLSLHLGVAIIPALLTSTSSLPSLPKNTPTARLTLSKSAKSSCKTSIRPSDFLTSLLIAAIAVSALEELRPAM